MKLKEIFTLPSSQEIARKTLRRMSRRKQLSENEQEDARQQFAAYMPSVKEYNISETALVIGHKYAPFQISADSASKSISLVTVSDVATFLGTRGSQMWFSFDGEREFQFPREDMCDDEQVSVVTAGMNEISMIRLKLNLQFKSVWDIEETNYSPPGKITVTHYE